MLTISQSRRRLCWALLLIILGTEIAAARPRIGLVLSGGGARGAAHIGVLKVLEELRVPIDAIAATSMGAIVGGAYAAGVPVAELETIISNVDWQDLFDDNPSRQLFSNRRKDDDRQNYSATVGLGADGVKLPQGAVLGQKLDLFLRDLVAPAARQTNFDQLPIPFRAVATDLVSGDMVVFASGRLNDAMRASMSVPGLIAPTEIDGRLLVDGGLVRNLPVAIARQMGVDRIIAVNLGSSLLDRSELNSVLGVTVQMITILTEQNVQASLANLNDSDVLILPELGTISSADFSRAAEAIASGEQAARSVTPALRQLSLSAVQYRRWRDRRLTPPDDAPASKPVTVSEIRVENLDRVNPRALAPLIKTRPGDTLDQATLDQDLSRLYGSGDFDRLSYRLLDGPDDSRAVVIDAFEKDWGPNYLRFGIGFSADLQDSNDYRFRFSYLRTWINPRGAEWQTDVQLGSNPQIDSEFYQPLNAGKPWFVAPFIGFSDRREDIFRDDNIIAEYDVITATAGVDLGLDLRERGELRLGLLFRAIDAEVGIGDPSLPTLSENSLGVQLRYGYDQLDNANFPTAGSAFGARLYATSDTLGADQSYSTLALQGLKAFSLSDRGTLLAGLRLGARLDQTIPVYDEFTLGGFLRLSGLQNDQLRGQYLGLGTLTYTHHLGNLGGDFGGGIYAGASLEAGNVWNSGDEIDIDNLRIGGSAFIGADSLIGPLYLAFGLSEGGNATPYIMLGRALR